jgi:hypothetical protein
VQARHGGLLIEAMEKERDRALRTLSGKAHSAERSRANVPQYGDIFLLPSDLSYPVPVLLPLGILPWVADPVPSGPVTPPRLTALPQPPAGFVLKWVLLHGVWRLAVILAPPQP